MLFLIFAGIVSLVFGILILQDPKKLKDMSKKFDKDLVHIEEKIYTLRQGIGVSMILASGMIFFVVYYIIRKY